MSKNAEMFGPEPQIRRRNKLHGHTTAVSNIIIYGYSQLSDAAKMTYIALEGYDWPDENGLSKGKAWPSIATLASDRSKSYDTICRHLKELDAAGLISIESGKQYGRANVYWLEEPEASEVEAYRQRCLRRSRPNVAAGGFYDDRVNFNPSATSLSSQPLASHSDKGEIAPIEAILVSTSPTPVCIGVSPLSFRTQALRSEESVAESLHLKETKPSATGSPTGRLRTSQAQNENQLTTPETGRNFASSDAEGSGKEREAALHNAECMSELASAGEREIVKQTEVEKVEVGGGKQKLPSVTSGEERGKANNSKGGNVGCLPQKCDRGLVKFAVPAAAFLPDKGIQFNQIKVKQDKEYSNRAHETGFYYGDRNENSNSSSSTSFNKRNQEREIFSSSSVSVATCDKGQEMYPIGGDFSPRKEVAKTSGAGGYSSYINQVMADFSRALHDDEHLRSNQSQANNLFREWVGQGVSEKKFVDLMYEAKKRAQWAALATPEMAQSPNRAAYFFTTLRKLLKDGLV